LAASTRYQARRDETRPVDFGRGAIRRARRWLRREINHWMFPEIRALALAAAQGATRSKDEALGGRCAQKRPFPDRAANAQFDPKADSARVP
jgi:hypothetical protein